MLIALMAASAVLATLGVERIWGAEATPPVMGQVIAVSLAFWGLISLLRLMPPGFTIPRPWRWWANTSHVPLLNHSRLMPRAIEYLARQRLTENRFKYRPSSYHALDAYTRDAKALRESGRYISANRVERRAFSAGPRCCPGGITAAASCC